MCVCTLVEVVTGGGMTSKFQMLIAFQRTITAGKGLTIATLTRTIFLNLPEIWSSHLPARVEIQSGVVHFIATPSLLS